MTGNTTNLVAAAAFVTPVVVLATIGATTVLRTLAAHRNSRRLPRRVPGAAFDRHARTAIAVANEPWVSPRAMSEVDHGIEALEEHANRGGAT